MTPTAAKSKPVVRPGQARCPGASIQDLIKRDPRPAPAYLTTESYEFLGDGDIPYERYTSPEFFKLEIDKMWSKVWQWACREEHIPNPGDYITYDIGPWSVVIVRTPAGEIKAYHNSCLHRGTQLKPSFSEGSSPELRCPYHGWSWDLDGELKHIICPWDFPHVDKAKFKLPEVRVGLWGGFVFINLDSGAGPLEDYLAPMNAHIPSSGIESRYIALHVEKELNCNWKIASEAFLEAMHVPETHPQLMLTNGDVNTQYDFYGDHINRLINAGGSPSPLLGRPVSEQELADAFFVGDPGDVSQRLVVPEGKTARNVVADLFRGIARQSTGVDYSGVNDSEMIDTIAYFIFPNAQVFTGVSFPIVYRFRPLGMDLQRSLFDLIILKPRPKHGTVETALPVRIKAEDSYSIVPGMDPVVGHVFDQDTGNMEAAQRGAMASQKTGATLANYQEIRIRHMHRTLGKYLGLGS